MSSRHRHSHQESARARRGRTALVVMISVAVLLVAAGVAVLVVQSPWIVAYRGQIIGFIGLGLLATLFSLPIIVAFQREPRHLSGPGHNPEQGTGPWKLP